MLKRTLTCIVAAALLVAPAGTATAAPPGDVLQQQLDAVHAAGMPGAFAEVRDGHRTWTPTTGVIDVRTGRPVRDGLRHRVGSITKTFVATTVLQLAGEQRVRLDAPVGRYLPELVPGEVGRQVTVRMLLNHTSGIGNYTNELLATEEDVVAVGRTTYRPVQLARIGLAMAPTNAPGAGWSYSNTNYVLAGLIVEKVTGRSLESEAARRILRPLHLRDTYFEGADPVIRGPHMHAYIPWSDGELRDFTRYNSSWAWGAGDLVSTAADLNRFYRALLTGRLLSARLLAEMQTTVPMDADDPEAGGYGLGLYWIEGPCGRFWGHDGGTVGHQTISWHSQDGKRQMTYAQSMAFYQTSPTEQHPIDEAAAEFWITALCGEHATAARTTAGFRPLRVDQGPAVAVSLR
jgi:D-alanyl-D-alanine carboxypeptidase